MVDNDGARHELTEALALLQEHMSELAAVERKRAALSATAAVADGTVVVTVNAHGVVSNAAIDESYLDEHDLAELGDFVTTAAQDAARDVERQAAHLLAPLAERRARFPSLADIVEGAPDIRDLLAHLHVADQGQPSAGVDDHRGEEPSAYPIVRSYR
jgi:DNA-binding protein YbaB